MVLSVLLMAGTPALVTSGLAYGAGSWAIGLYSRARATRRASEAVLAAQKAAKTWGLVTEALAGLQAQKAATSLVAWPYRDLLGKEQVLLVTVGEAHRLDELVAGSDDDDDRALQLLLAIILRQQEDRKPRTP